jgi:hypothetical protein
MAFTRLSVVLWLAVWSSPVAGQVPLAEPGPRLTSVWQPWDPGSPATSSLIQTVRAKATSSTTKWAIGGAIVGGVVSAAVANALCERQSGCSGPTLKWGLIGGVVGAALGAFIGESNKGDS